MPITRPALVSNEITSITFNTDDTLGVTLVQFLDGTLNSTQTFVIPAVHVTPVLNSQTVGAATIRQTLIGVIYGYLIASGLVVGIVE